MQALAGLAAATLGKGDAKAAEQAIANLEKADPTSEDLPQFKEKLAGLKNSGQWQKAVAGRKRCFNLSACCLLPTVSYGAIVIRTTFARGIR